jgi:hypothetical protein
MTGVVIKKNFFKRNGEEILLDIAVTSPSLPNAEISNPEPDVERAWKH